MKYRIFCLFVLLGLLSGCSQSSDKDLKDWVEQVKQKPGKPIKQIPPPAPYERVVYQANGRRSPFQASLMSGEKEDITPEQSCRVDLIPDRNRVKEELENYPLDAYELVGVIEGLGVKSGVLRGISSTNSGLIYRVSLGNYLGSFDGRIVAIMGDRIEIEELFPDDLGCWEKRTTYLIMQESN